MLLVIVAILSIIIYVKLTKKVKYWREKNVVHESGWPIFGNMTKVVFKKQHIMDLMTELYQKFSNHKWFGIHQFGQPILVVRDPDLIKKVAVKDFAHFRDHLGYSRLDKDPLLSKSLVALVGDEWHQMRVTISPVFTSSKIKLMYELITECAENFVSYFKGKEQISVDMKELSSRFAADIIATTAFGIKINSLENPKNDFFTMGNRLGQTGITQLIKFLIMVTIPPLAKILGFQVFPPEVNNFFRKIIKDNILDRERNQIVRPDLIHLLLEGRKGLPKNDESLRLSDDDIAAQAMLFFFAGFDTAATATSFMAYELAINVDVQKKLQQEIDNINQNGKVSYETILSLEYLDQVISEGLRLWPPNFKANRICTKDYQISDPDYLIKKGDAILIPIAAIHRDPEYFPEPLRFDPERFNADNKHKILPGTYMPFGIGPRNCLGSRFALMEMKTFFFHLLSKFEIVALNETHIPLTLSARSFRMEPLNGCKLALKPRKLI